MLALWRHSDNNRGAGAGADERTSRSYNSFFYRAVEEANMPRKVELGRIEGTGRPLALSLTQSRRRSSSPISRRSRRCKRRRFGEGGPSCCFIAKDNAHRNQARVSIRLITKHTYSLESSDVSPRTVIICLFFRFTIGTG